MNPLHAGPLPFVGRSVELAEARATLDALKRGAGATWFVVGDAGVGKTRLAQAVLDEAERRGWSVASGRAFPVESGMPYALFADALLPTVRRLAPETLEVLTRGVGELTLLFPWLAGANAAPVTTMSADFRSRLHWHFAQFVRDLAQRQPIVVVLEDLQWADTSSLELLHFVARQLTDAPLFLYCTYNPDHPSTSADLRALHRSLCSMGVARQWPLGPLAEPALAELLQRTFSADPMVSGDFSAMLFRWTRGNPFFIEETLKSLIDSGVLRSEGGRWVGWDASALRLPPSVRDAVLTRLASLSAPAREAAESAAVLGARFTFETLAAVLRADDDALLGVLDELRRARVIDEVIEGTVVVWDFAHPLIRETLYADMGAVRLRLLHARVGAALEDRYGAAALDHADELAYHYARAHSTNAGHKALHYLHRAGVQALEMYANREAADYLTQALALMEEAPSVGMDDRIDTIEALARAQQRLGKYELAMSLWQRVEEWAVTTGDVARGAAIARRQGLACYWTGRPGDALSHFGHGIERARGAGSHALLARLLTARAVCLQELGRSAEALESAEEALTAAQPCDDPCLQVRVHRAFMQLHLWKGDAQHAREHGMRALELAASSCDSMQTFMVRWAMALLEGFAGNSAAVNAHLTETRRLADELRSPVLRAWSAELSLEYASACGQWTEGLALGEDAIRLARALNQWTLLPRLLVWTGLIYLGRSEFERGEAYVEEAWRLSGAENGSYGGVNVHAVVPAYIGRAGVCLARGDYAGAVRLGSEGLALADRTGNVMWGVHRLLPIIAESCLWMRDLDGARRTGARLRHDAERLGHRLGMAWADACDALVTWLEGDSERGALMLREAAERLEAVPFMADATRLRRQLAGRLAEIGDRAGAVRELRLVHDRLTELGAMQELRKARQQFKELGTRPPPRSAGRSNGGNGVLTGRESVIASLVAARRSSKAIARELDISVRTVDAHLTNIYRKLDINSRSELTDLVRTGELISD
jgi:DNA-binding CsgD family transcriptional regulator/tetratricopeptide (TPR) repeat protein